MKKHLFALSHLILLLIITSCEESKIETAQDIVNASITFHDPENKWKSLNAEFVFQSKFEFNDSVPEELHININVQNNNFRYTNLDRKVDISYSQDSCIVNQGNTNCNSYAWTKNFYTYIWGLPMKLNDPGTTINPNFTLDTIQQIPVYNVSVPYHDENYQFYFHQKTYELKFFQFIKNNETGHGEFITLSEIYEHNGIKFPKHKRWEQLSSRELIGTNEVLSIIKGK